MSYRTDLSLAHRKPYSIMVLRAKDTPYQLMADNQVLNHFKIHFLNQSPKEQAFELTLPEAEAALGIKLTQAKIRHTLKTGEGTESHFFLTLPKSVFNSAGEKPVHLEVKDHVSGLSEVVRLVAVGPRAAN